MSTQTHGATIGLPCIQTNERDLPFYPGYVSGPTQQSQTGATSRSIAPPIGADCGSEDHNGALSRNRSHIDSNYVQQPFSNAHAFFPEKQVDYNPYMHPEGSYDPPLPDGSTSSTPGTTNHTLPGILHERPSQLRTSQASDCFGPPVSSQQLNENTCSPSTFFATHKAHRSFRGVVEKFHQNSDNGSGAAIHESADWHTWNPSSKEAFTNALKPNNPSASNRDLTASRHPAQYPSQAEPQEMPAPYITRSQVHRLAEARQDPTRNQAAHVPSNSGTRSPFQHQSPSHPHLPTTSRPKSSIKTRSSQSSNVATAEPINNSNGQTRGSGERYNKDPGELKIDIHLSGPERTNDGLPSNSHHLLNSPENNSYRVSSTTQTFQNRESVPQNAKPTRERGTSAALRQSVDQPYEQAASNPRQSNSTFAGTRTHLNRNRHGPAEEVRPHPDDAASLLLALSRSDEAKHGMALRRGRGSAPRNGTSQPDSSTTQVSSDKPAAPSTPSGRRYRTRSQIHDEFPPVDHGHHPSHPSTIDPASAPIYATRARGAKAGQSHPHHLGHGLPPLPDADHYLPHLSVSGSTAASTCTSQSVDDGHSIAVQAHENFMGHNSSYQPQNRGRARISDCSTTPSVMTTGTVTSNSTTFTGAVDDDARSCFSISTQATSLASPAEHLTQRRFFPPEVPIDPHFPRLYRAFYVSSAFGEREMMRSEAERSGIVIPKEPPNGVYNSPAHGHLDLYTPRFVKGVGSEKVGLCCICAEPRQRGGEDLQLWLKMKVSSYSYHLGFFHGINNANGLPFSPPVEIRLTKRGQVAANEKSELKEGRCHQCDKWIAMEGVKLQEVKVPELFWWKHAKSCHKSRLAGECHVHVEDDLFDLVTNQRGAQAPLSSGSTGSKGYQFPTPYQFSQNNCNGTASPALTVASGGGGSVSGSGNRIHPSVAAQRASAGRVYKRKASNSSLIGGGTAMKESYSPHSVGFTPSTSSTFNLLNHHQQAQSPTPQPSYENTFPVRKTRRTNAMKPSNRTTSAQYESGS
ncbi:uncharacterized protein MELLADRAFT_77369 [Melampsora larici-populina 98AG31]|uniref:Transcription regulator Rua1 C-terminal domain-containing protein n=1 Tax=Melampsora larici-populina (strain 98AG31 / pathotype 3-4-7) TaxID=747676 RepID=F4RGQ6_MELLP|nr:uncharacterized protein MELLADRAFT_77369 [Melampsora larici-populina 98AG31]EGG08581.1 hypothetical protein MELLADRAFT_77369 [Melampsora larici-populina 98AG31]